MDRKEMLEALRYALEVSAREGGATLDLGCLTAKAILAALSSPCACGGRTPIKQWPDTLRRYPGGAEDLIGSWRKQKPGDVLVDVLVLPGGKPCS